MTAIFPRGPTFIYQTPVVTPSWVGYELENLNGIPIGYEEAVKSFQEPKTPTTSKTIAGNDPELWAEVAGIYDGLMVSYMSRGLPSSLRAAELAEWRKMNVKSSGALAALQPESVSEDFPPHGKSIKQWKIELETHPELRYRTKTGFKLPSCSGKVADLIVGAAQELRSDELDREFSHARATTNPGYPFLDAEGHSASAAIAYLARDHATLNLLQEFSFRVVNGWDMPACYVRGGRVQENRTDLPLLLRNATGVIQRHGTIVGGARDRDIYMGDRSRSDITRLGSRYGLKGMKTLFPQMDLRSPSYTYKRVLQFAGDDDEPKLEGDAERFDANASQEVLDWSLGTVGRITKTIDPRLDLVDGVVRDYSGGLVTLTVSSTLPGKAAFRAQLGLPSGIAPTSFVANAFQCNAQSGALLSVTGEDESKLDDPEFRMLVPSVWYGDDDLTRATSKLDTKTKTFVGELKRMYAMMGSTYSFVDGEVILRTWRGQRLMSRMIWRSVDFERTTDELIQDLGTAARWLYEDEDSKPMFYDDMWAGMMKIRSVCNRRTYRSARIMFIDATDRLMSSLAGKKRLDDWVSDQTNSPFWDLYASLLNRGSYRLTAATKFENREAAVGVLVRYLRQRTGENYTTQIMNIINQEGQDA